MRYLLQEHECTVACGKSVVLQCHLLSCDDIRDTLARLLGLLLEEFNKIAGSEHRGAKTSVENGLLL